MKCQSGVRCCPSREQICQWAEQLNISFIDDPSNNNTHYDRAWCRTMLWPLLASRFSKMQQAVTRTASLMQDADEILQEVLQEDLKIVAMHSSLISQD